MTAGAQYQGLASVSAATMCELQRRAVLVCQPVISVPQQGEHDWIQIDSTLGKPILVTNRTFAIGDLL
jgi:hypothetical protein